MFDRKTIIQSDEAISQKIINIIATIAGWVLISIAIGIFVIIGYLLWNNFYMGAP